MSGLVSNLIHQRCIMLIPTDNVFCCIDNVVSNTDICFWPSKEPGIIVMYQVMAVD